MSRRREPTHRPFPTRQARLREGAGGVPGKGGRRLPLGTHLLFGLGPVLLFPSLGPAFLLPYGMGPFTYATIVLHGVPSG